MSDKEKNMGNVQGAGAARGEPRAFEGVAAREKTWDECGIEEKVGRLRDVLRYIETMAQHTLDNMKRLDSQFEQHAHDGQDRVMVKLGRERAEPPLGYLRGRDSRLD